jgi:hypothetical protein
MLNIYSVPQSELGAVVVKEIHGLLGLFGHAISASEDTFKQIARDALIDLGNNIFAKAWDYFNVSNITSEVIIAVSPMLIAIIKPLLIIAGVVLFGIVLAWLIKYIMNNRHRIVGAVKQAFV